MDESSVQAERQRENVIQLHGFSDDQIAQVRRIARLEAMNMLSLLRDKFGNIPQTPDGYVKAKDLYEIFAIADHEARLGG